MCSRGSRPRGHVKGERDSNGDVKKDVDADRDNYGKGMVMNDVPPSDQNSDLHVYQ